MSALRQRSMTLIEVAIATSVLSVLMLGLLSSLNVAQRSSFYVQERQAALEAAQRQLDLVTSAGDIDAILRVPGVGSGAIKNVTEYAFQVPLRGSTLAPATATWLPLNADDPATSVDEREFAGHVRVIEDVDGDGVLTSDEDFDDDGAVDLIEVQVIVAWRSKALDGADSQVELISRVHR